MKRFVSWNVNGLRAAEKKGFIDVVTDFDADLFAIQETKAQPEQLSDAVKNINGYTSYFSSAVKKGYAGVAVYAKKEPLKVDYGLGDEQFDSEGRTLILEYEDFFLMNLYFPNSQPKLVRMDYKLGFNNAILEKAKELCKNKTVVICGDLNVAHKPIDLKNPKQNENNPGYSIQEREWMDSFVEAGFTDTFRMFNQEPGQYTWWSYRFNARAKNIGWRLDYFCVDEKSRVRVKKSLIHADVMGSDHCPVSLEME